MYFHKAKEFLTKINNLLDMVCLFNGLSESNIEIATNLNPRTSLMKGQGGNDLENIFFSWKNNKQNIKAVKKRGYICNILNCGCHGYTNILDQLGMSRNFQSLVNLLILALSVTLIKLVSMLVNQSMQELPNHQMPHSISNYFETLQSQVGLP